MIALALFLAASGPTVPVTIEAIDNLDPCGNGVIVGLKASGDGFLSVRDGPSTWSRELARLHNGDVVFMCDMKRDWVGIVWDRDRDNGCGVTTPWVRTLPYTGPCRSGWVHRRFVELFAG